MRVSGFFLLSLLILSTGFVRAQDNDGMQASANTSIDVRYGAHYLRKDSLDKFLHTKDSVNFFKYSTIVSISFAETFNNVRFGKQDGFISLQYQLPNMITGYDSINYTFSGYQIGISMGGKDFLSENKDLDLVFAGGVQFGYYYLKRENLRPGVPIQRSKNGIIAPQLIVEARYFIGMLKLAFNMRVQYDVSSGQWNHINPSSTDFGGFKATGFAFQGVIGFRIN